MLEIVETVRAAYMLSDDRAIEGAGYDVRHRPPPCESNTLDLFDLADASHTEALQKVTPAAASSDDRLDLDALD